MTPISFFFHDGVKYIPKSDPRSAGSSENFIRLFKMTYDWERAAGLRYYDEQRERIAEVARKNGQLLLHPSVAAFAALSPLNAESTNYTALDTCLKIAAGKLPEDTRVIAWRPNKVKALRVLRGEDPAAVLGGRKVTAFYYNTLDPTSEVHVTIDGHMYNVWTWGLRPLRRVPQMSAELYNQIADDLRAAGRDLGIPAPKLQSILWNAWKRVHGILYTPPPDDRQRKFDFGH
jgi:hypothetical protein